MDTNPRQNILWEIKFDNNTPMSVIYKNKSHHVQKTMLPPTNADIQQDVLKSLKKMKEEYDIIKEELSKSATSENDAEILNKFFSSSDLIQNLSIFIKALNDILKNYFPPPPPPENPEKKPD